MPIDYTGLGRKTFVTDPLPTASPLALKMAKAFTEAAREALREHLLAGRLGSGIEDGEEITYYPEDLEYLEEEWKK